MAPPLPRRERGGVHITVYPEMGKVGLYAGAAPGGPKEERLFTKYLRDEEVDYWE